MSTFEARQPERQPTGIKGRWGKKWGGAFGAQKDKLLTDAKDAVKSGFVALAPVDSFPRHGADTELEQLPGETDDGFRARVRGAWEFWSWAGSGRGLSTALDLLGYADNYQLKSGHDFSLTLWAQWFALISSHSFAVTTWGAPSLWGAPSVWGSSATSDDVRRHRGLMRKVSNARDRGWLVFTFTTPGVWGIAKWGAPLVWGGQNIRWRV